MFKNGYLNGIILTKSKIFEIEAILLERAAQNELDKAKTESEIRAVRKKYIGSHGWLTIAQTKWMGFKVSKQFIPTEVRKIIIKRNYISLDYLVGLETIHNNKRFYPGDTIEFDLGRISFNKWESGKKPELSIKSIH